MRKIGIGLQVVLYSFASILGAIGLMVMVFVTICLVTAVTQDLLELTLREKLLVLAVDIFLFRATYYLAINGEEFLGKAKKAFNSE
jgi:hypothetical protein